MAEGDEDEDMGPTGAAGALAQRDGFRSQHGLGTEAGPILERVPESLSGAPAERDEEINEDDLVIIHTGLRLDRELDEVDERSLG